MGADARLQWEPSTQLELSIKQQWPLPPALMLSACRLHLLFSLEASPEGHFPARCLQWAWLPQWGFPNHFWRMTMSVQSDNIICCILLAFVFLGGHSDPPGTFQGGLQLPWCGACSHLCWMSETHNLMMFRCLSSTTYFYFDIYKYIADFSFASKKWWISISWWSLHQSPISLKHIRISLI